MTNLLAPTIWHKQPLHFIALVVLLIASISLFELFYETTSFVINLAFYIALFSPVIHQIYVWLVWRLQLNRSVGNIMPFKLYVALFFILFSSRFFSLFYLAWVDSQSFLLNEWTQYTVAALFLLIGLYAMYSVKRYFGMARASGADHFDKRYQELPLVKKGIFRFTNNGMYVYAFLIFWAIAIGFNSMSALIVAGFSHAYIWVHFYCTEKPDMDFIYASK